ncbi:5-oxoprolinase subunit PxpB [Algoriphagus sp.]|uniref:5-oxoprolinase subunit PxpB n=1 Tax=Algoriphagus sp. TaxID=1872435 RepID=UPI00327C988C
MKPALSQITPLLYEFEWKSAISDTLLQRQLSFRSKLQQAFSKEILELRMGFKTLAFVLGRPIAAKELSQWLASLTLEETLLTLPEKIWQIPVCYSDETGRDLATLSKAKNISKEELIFHHTQPLYRLHFYGFLPGFMYLSGLSEMLHSPRKSVPDRAVPAGSVAIGADQTGIYPSVSPGGWHLIGQTPTRLFDPNQTIPVFAEPGERIEFIPISVLEYDLLKRHPNPPNFR